MAVIYGAADSEVRLLGLYPGHIRGIGDIARAEARVREGLGEGAAGLLARIRRWRLKRQHVQLERNRSSPYHAGAVGENRAIGVLSRLGDGYHVLCGVRINLPYFISYGGRKNLGSAQIDFVVVSRNGVFVVEVKNWSDDYVRRGGYFSPHEQAGRAGRLLWHVLKSWRNVPGRVTSVVLSIRGNIRYDPDHRAVFVADLGNINRLLEGGRDEISEVDVGRIVARLRGHVAMPDRVSRA